MRVVVAGLGVQGHKRRRIAGADFVAAVDPVNEDARSHGKLATVTAVPALARFGNIIFEGDRVADFAEKRVTDDAWINGGYMVMEPGALAYLSKDEDVLEVDLLERLTGDGQLAAYRHEGFWQCMDTLRDKQGLERLWSARTPPWKRW